MNPAANGMKLIKLTNVAYPTRLADLNRSNPFNNSFSPTLDGGSKVPDAWLSDDVKNESTLIYTRDRDIHSVGIVFLQMCMGLSVVENYADIHVALIACAFCRCKAAQY